MYLIRTVYYIYFQFYHSRQIQPIAEMAMYFNKTLERQTSTTTCSWGNRLKYMLKYGNPQQFRDHSHDIFASFITVCHFAKNFETQMFNLKYNICPTKKENIKDANSKS